jgi:hypothetical protein
MPISCFLDLAKKLSLVCYLELMLLNETEFDKHVQINIHLTSIVQHK